jgi:cysteine desulfurase/selenocysteine lyase
LFLTPLKDVKVKRKADFPFFSYHKGIVYLDTAATAQKPQVVLDAMNGYYTQHTTNSGRGIYQLAEMTTQKCHDVRQKVADFIGASTASEIIFNAGATAGINFVANSWGQQHIKAGDEIIITQLEHHANFVPWQQLCQQKGAVLKIIPVDKNGQLQVSDIDQWVTSKTKLVAMTHVSNVLGTINPSIKLITQAARKVGAKVLLDGAQAVKSLEVDVQELDCDFYIFSGHKIYGPTGIGVLYCKKEVQKEIAPIAFGGGAVINVLEDTTELLPAPECFEPGTLPLAQIIGLGAAIDYIKSIGLLKIHEHLNQLTNQLLDGLKGISAVTSIGSEEQLRKEATMVSFVVDGMHPHDVAALLDSQGICVRAGHHCAQPLAAALGYNATIRVSFGLYNDAHDIQKLLDALKNL